MYVAIHIHGYPSLNFIQSLLCGYIRMVFSQLRSKKPIMIHKSCVPHSRETAKCMYTGVYSDVVGKILHFKQT